MNNKGETDMRMAIAGILVIVVLALFMVRVGYFGQGALAVVCPTCVLGNATQGTDYNLLVKVCIDDNSKPINNFRVTAQMYGPDASDISGGCNHPGSELTVNSLNTTIAAGQCGYASITINTNNLVGSDYHIISHVYDGDTLISSGIANTAESDITCPYTNEELSAAGCAFDQAANKYVICTGTSFKFDVTPKGNVTPNCTDTIPVCTSNKSYSYFSCLTNSTIKTNCTTDQICQSGKCISINCSPVGSTKNDSCPTGYTPSILIDKLKCSANGTWIDNKPTETCTKGVGDITVYIIIGILALLILIGLIFGRK